jgi:hypothetical protein
VTDARCRGRRHSLPSSVKGALRQKSATQKNNNNNNNKVTYSLNILSFENPRTKSTVQMK